MIARLIKERDDARKALSQVRGGGANINNNNNNDNTTGGEGMEGVENGITEDLKQRMKETADGYVFCSIDKEEYYNTLYTSLLY